MSMVLGLKLKSAMRIKMLRNSSKRLGGSWHISYWHISVMDLVRIASSATINLYLVLLDLCLV